MKTRTLLLLALGCGMAILLAGGVLLFQVAGSDDAAPAAVVGEQVEVGDMRVTVDSFDELDGEMIVGVTMGGVDDLDAADGFALIAAGRSTAPVASGSDPHRCQASTVERRQCVLYFDVAGADGDSRTLVYRRGESQARWVLHLDDIVS